MNSEAALSPRQSSRQQQQGPRQQGPRQQGPRQQQRQQQQQDRPAQLRQHELDVEELRKQVQEQRKQVLEQCKQVQEQQQLLEQQEALLLSRQTEVQPQQHLGSAVASSPILSGPVPFVPGFTPVFPPAYAPGYASGFPPAFAPGYTPGFSPVYALGFPVYAPGYGYEAPGFPVYAPGYGYEAPWYGAPAQAFGEHGPQAARSHQERRQPQQRGHGQRQQQAHNQQQEQQHQHQHQHQHLHQRQHEQQPRHRQQSRQHQSHRLSADVQRLRAELNDAANVGNIDLTERLMAELRELGDAPTTVSLNILIKAFARAGQPHRGYEVLCGMLANEPAYQGAAASQGTFNAVVTGFAEADDLETAWQVLSMQHAAGLDIYLSFCAILRTIRTPSDVLSTLSSATIVYGLAMSNKMLATALAALLEPRPEPRLRQQQARPAAPAGTLSSAHLEAAQRAVAIAGEHGVVVDNKSCMLLLGCYVSAGRTRDGLLFFDQFLARGALPDLRLVTSVIDAMVSADPPLMSSASAMLERMTGEFSLRPDAVAYNAMIKGYGRVRPHPDVASATAMFESVLAGQFQGVRATEFTFSAIANVLTSVGKIEEAEAVVRRMPEHGLRPTSVHYNILLKGYSRCRCRLLDGRCTCRVCECSDPERALLLMQEMEGLGLTCDALTITSIIEAFCSSAQTDKAMQVVEKVLLNPFNPSSLRPTANVFNVLLHGVCVKYRLGGRLSCHSPASAASSGSRGDGDEQDEADGAAVEAAAARALLYPAEGASLSLVEAEVRAIADKMRQCDVEPDDVWHNTLLTIYCAFGCSTRAKELLLERLAPPCEYHSDLEARVGFNTCLNGLAHPLSEVAADPPAMTAAVAELLHEMHSKNVAPDSITLNTVVKILVKVGRLAEAERWLVKLGRAIHSGPESPGAVAANEEAPHIDAETRASAQQSIAAAQQDAADNAGPRCESAAALAHAHADAGVAVSISCCGPAPAEGAKRAIAECQPIRAVTATTLSRLVNGLLGAGDVMGARRVLLLGEREFNVSLPQALHNATHQ
jgi:pentatricopeptide repeat protein